MSTIINKMTAMVIHACPVATCGVEFATTAGYDGRRREDGNSFRCPNGHGMSYTVGKSDAEKLREAKAAQALAEGRASEAEAHLERERMRLNKKVQALVKRAHDGICPLCPRTISPSRMTRHIETKHKAAL